MALMARKVLKNAGDVTLTHHLGILKTRHELGTFLVLGGKVNYGQDLVQKPHRRVVCHRH
jgi:hypothetical protein